MAIPTQLDVYPYLEECQYLFWAGYKSIPGWSLILSWQDLFISKTPCMKCSFGLCVNLFNPNTNTSVAVTHPSSNIANFT